MKIVLRFCFLTMLGLSFANECVAQGLAKHDDGKWTSLENTSATLLKSTGPVFLVYTGEYSQLGEDADIYYRIYLRLESVSARDHTSIEGVIVLGTVHDASYQFGELATADVHVSRVPNGLNADGTLVFVVKEAGRWGSLTDSVSIRLKETRFVAPPDIKAFLDEERLKRPPVLRRWRLEILRQ